MTTMVMAQQKPIERTSTDTKSEEEELQQIEADLQEEKIHALRNRIDNILGSLMETSHPTASQQQQQTESLLLPGRVWVTDPYGDQGQYKGVVDDDGMPHGTGDMIYVDGRKYQGQWCHGQWHGTAKAQFQNGDIFEGEYNFDQRHGPGLYKWSDGRVYNGEFHEDKRHGRGEFRWPDNSCYTGNFQNGHRHGEGTYTFPDGSVYSGSWRTSQMHGQGKCIWADGRIYTGTWALGKAHGQGKEIRPDGSIRHDGLWSEDKPIRSAPVGANSTDKLDTSSSATSSSQQITVGTTSHENDTEREEITAVTNTAAV